jgi:arsenite methyltransferase
VAASRRQQAGQSIERARRGSYAGCTAGALSFGGLGRGLTDADFIDVAITAAHEVAPDKHAAVIRATNPTARPRTSSDSPE